MNARSIVNKLTELELCIKIEQPDIVGITETWLNESISDSELSFEGYTLFRNDRVSAIKKRGWGVAMLVKNELNPVIRAEFTHDSFPEVLFCTINCGGETTFSGVCHRPPDSQTINDEGLFEIMGLLRDKTFVLMGDFNYPELNWGVGNSLDGSHSFIECLENNFFDQIVSEPTRDKNYLDLILCSDKNLVNQLSVDEPFGNSDHQLIRFSLIAKRGGKHKGVKVYEYFKVNYDAIRQHVETLGWDALKESNDVETIWGKLKSDLISTRDLFIKMRKLGKNKAKWVTKKAMQLRLAKKQAWVRYQNSGRDRKFYDVYKAKLKLSVTENKRAKLAFEKKLADNVKQNPKSFYSYIGSKSRSNNKIGPLKRDNGEVANDNKECANLLNNYFSSVFTNENLQYLPNPPQVYNGEPEDSFLDLEITEQCVLNKLTNINVNKSVGPDEIHPKLLYEVRDKLVGPLCKLYKLTMELGKIPQDWKDANVMPLFKKGNRDQPQNYRPVSLTSILGKIMEGLIKDRLVYHLEKFKLINNTQHGFRNGLSCLTNLLEFLENVTGKLDQGDSIDLIYLDFAKAFDKVPYRRLLIKLESHGVKGNSLKWIENWLDKRRQRVGVDGIYSDWVSVTSGVPQGSVLGPVLFIIYINDIDVGLLSKLAKFADDSKLLNSVNSQRDIDVIRQDLNNLEQWAEKWQMEFNVNKCSVVHLGKKKNPSAKYYLYGNEIKSSVMERDLGIF